VTRGYLLTCGTSLLGNLQAHASKKPVGPEKPVGALLAQALSEVSSELFDAIRPGENNFTYVPTLDGILRDFPGLRGLALQVTADGTVASDIRSLGAELESLGRRMCGQGLAGEELRPEDPIALIVSDTSDGRTCGLLIASMTGRRIRVLTHGGDRRETINGWDMTEECPAHPGMPAEAAPLDLYVIPNLAVVSEGAMSDAAPWLAGAIARTVGGVVRGDHWSEVVENEAEISGGYKATLPLIHALLEYCAALRTARRITCVLRHEAAPDVWIRAGLRSLTRDELAQRLEELREADLGRTPENPLLRGFGWRYSDGPGVPRPELTPEGYGILAFPAPS
jgi:hypothetical protein